MNKKILSFFLSLIMIFSISTVAFAEEESQPKAFLALGAEQNSSEREKTLSLLNIKNSELENYKLLYVTNEDEHNYLGSYMSKSLIGTRALSCVLVTPAKSSTGITVSCININYCTPGMYRNALITAGVTDANVEVVAPYALPGTAALVGAMKSFEVMSGEELPDEAKDAATNELVTTGEIGKSIGDTEKAEELVALVKATIIENGITDKKDISKLIDDGAQALSINLSDDDKELVADLMQKISSLNLDVDKIKTQAKDLYEKLSEIDIDPTIWNAIKNFFANLWKVIVEFFQNILPAITKDEVSTTELTTLETTEENTTYSQIQTTLAQTTQEVTKETTTLEQTTSTTVPQTEPSTQEQTTEKETTTTTTQVQTENTTEPITENITEPITQNQDLPQE